MLLELGASPSGGGRVGRSRKPPLDTLIFVSRLEREHQVAQHEDAVAREQVACPCKRDSLPKIRQMVERVPRVHELRRFAIMLVREEAGRDEVDVVLSGGVRAFSGCREHRGRWIDGDYASTL